MLLYCTILRRITNAARPEHIACSGCSHHGNPRGSATQPPEILSVLYIRCASLVYDNREVRCNGMTGEQTRRPRSNFAIVSPTLHSDSLTSMETLTLRPNHDFKSNGKASSGVSYLGRHVDISGVDSFMRDCDRIALARGCNQHQSCLHARPCAV